MEYNSKKIIYTIVFIFLFCFAIISELYGLNSFQPVEELEPVSARYTSGHSESDNSYRFKIAPKISEIKSKKLLNILESVEKTQGEKRPWRVLHASSTKLVLYKYPCILAYSLSPENQGIYSATNILELDPRLNWKRTNVRANTSPDGALCIIAAEEREGKDSIDNIYLYNISDDSRTVIGVGQMKNLATAWSMSSQFYVFADRISGEIVIYDTVLGIRNKILFKSGEIKDVFVCNSGDILVDSDKKYIIKKDNPEEQTLTKIKGDIICFSEEETIYFSNGSLYSYVSNKGTMLKSIGSKLSIEAVNSTGASFSNDIYMVGFDNRDKATYTYSLFTKEQPKVFNSSFTRYAASDNSEIIKIVDYIGKIHEIPKTSLSEAAWLDDNNLAVVTTNSDTRSSPEFEIMIYNIEKSEKHVLN